MEKLGHRAICIVLSLLSTPVLASSIGPDPLLGQQDYLDAIRWRQGADRLLVEPQRPEDDVVIAIIDYGTDIDHEDLRENLWTNPKEIPGNGRDDDHNGYADDVHGYNFRDDVADPSPVGPSGVHDHGTIVAGYAAARANNGKGITGVAGYAKIMALNMAGHDVFVGESLFSSPISDAIRYAADNGADIINLSVQSSTKMSGVEKAIRYAISKGVLVVHAAGNDARQLALDPKSRYGYKSPTWMGGDTPGMIVVGSVDSDTLDPSSFTSFDSHIVRIMAPGAKSSSPSRGLLTTLPGNRYGGFEKPVLCGTSFAAPLVTGAAALAKAYGRRHGVELSPLGLEQLILESARKIPALETYAEGGRLLDIGALADLLEKQISSK